MPTRPTRRDFARWIALAPWFPAVAAADDPPIRSLRVATFNIHHGEGDDGRLDLDRVVAAVRGADVVAFQEVDVRFRARSRFEDQAEALAGRLGGKVAFGGNLVEGDGRYGVALVTRFPIVAQRNHALPRSPGREKAEPRGLLEATVDAGGRPVRFFVTHLAHDSPADRKLQVARVRDLVLAGTGPFVLMGDLNLRPDTADYADLVAPAPGGDGGPWVVDAWVRAGRGDGATIGLGGKSPGRIDYILASPDVAAGLDEVRVDATTKASDHQPVLATFRWPPA